MIQIAQVTSGLLPVVAFLGALIFLDSYKLVKRKDIALAIVFGGISAILAMFFNQWILDITEIGLI